MSDFNLVDPRGWEYDLQSVYSAYMGHFQLHCIPWYERSWGVFFESFEEFLTFSWPVITITDRWTGKAHIVTRMTSIGAFLKMIKTRFGETLPMVDNIQQVTPFETSQRHMRTITDYTIYKKLYSTLPATALASLRVRVREGEPRAIRDLWQSRDKNFVAIDFEWSERNASSCLEWGYAAARCPHLDAVGVWPPDPDVNYRRGHYIINEYIDKQHNKHRPNFPWAYAFGDSQVTPRAKLPPIMQAIFSTMTSPESETIPSTLVLVGHGILSDIKRMEEMRIRIPHNVLIIDIAHFERQLYASKQRGEMIDSTGQPRVPGSSLSLPALLQSLNLDIQPPLILNNAGNDAFLILLAFQLLLNPENTKIPRFKERSFQQAVMRNVSRSPMAFSPSMAMGMGMNVGMNNMGMGVPMGMGMNMNMNMGMPMGGMMPIYPMMPMIPPILPTPPLSTPPSIPTLTPPSHTPSPSPRSPNFFHDRSGGGGGGGGDSAGDSRRSSGSYFPPGMDTRPRKPSGLVPVEGEGRVRKVSASLSGSGSGSNLSGGGGGGGGTNSSGGGSGGGSNTPGIDTTTPSHNNEEKKQDSKADESGADEVAEGLDNLHV